ncbi:MAG: DUF1467 family protein [Alphaproteobacteria bacterium]|nr:DUF1467 family protein [Alphaproteobacteria bacterium]
MAWTGALAIYFILWWVVLFAVLPFGAHSAHELGQDVEAGHAPSAPVAPRLIRKFLITTVVSGIIFAGVYYVQVNKLITLDSLPF